MTPAEEFAALIERARHAKAITDRDYNQGSLTIGEGLLLEEVLRATIATWESVEIEVGTDPHANNPIRLQARSLRDTALAATKEPRP